MANKKNFEVLAASRDFEHLKNKGQRKLLAPWLLINYQKTEEGKFRCGWTIPGKVAPSVIRNKLKRWARNYFRKRFAENEPPSMDVNLVFFKAKTPDFYKRLKYAEFQNTMDSVWKKIG